MGAADAAARAVALPEDADTATGVADYAPELAAYAAAVAASLPATIASRLTAWQPQLVQRNIPPAQWRRFEPLVRAAATCAAPSSEPVAGEMLSVALGLTAFAATRRMPLRADVVFRATTVEAWMRTLSAGTRHPYGSMANALVAGVTAALSGAPAPAPAARAEGEPQDRTDPDPAEPLLLDAPAPAPEALARLALTGTAAVEALAALALVRARVLEMEPAALRAEPRTRGRGKAIPYGDVEVVALLAAAAAQRVAKRRIHAAAAICLGVGAGVVGTDAASVRATDVLEVVTAAGAAVAVRAGARVVPVHAAFVPGLRRAAAAAGADGFLVGGRGDRLKRIGAVYTGVAASDPSLPRLNSARLQSTWVAMQATRGVPFADLLAASGWSSTEPLDTLLPLLPRTAAGAAALAGLTGLAPVSGSVAR